MASSQIYLASTFRDLWEGFLREWFSEVVRHSWKFHLPTVVLVPHRAYGNYLKACLVEAGLNYAGIFFWTPFQCRESLFSYQKNIPRVLEKEDLDLLIASLADFSEDRDYANAIGADAGHLRQCLELIDSSGWNPEKIFPAPVQKIIRQLDEKLSSTGLSRQHSLELLLMEKFYSSQSSSENQSPDCSSLIESLLVVGFDGSKWPARPLIHAASLASHRTAFAFILSPTDTTDMDRAWVRYWEHLYSPAIPVSIKRKDPYPYSGLFEGEKAGKIQVRIGKNMEEQISSIVVQTIAYLSDPSCTRLGILFPGSGALARETSTKLSELKIPHQDAIRHWRMDQSQNKPWKAWLNLQKHWNLTLFLKFVQAGSVIANDFGMEIRKIHRSLEKAFGEVLVEDLDVLIAYLSRSEHPDHQQLIEKLQCRPRLAEQGYLKDYVSATKQALHQMELDALYSSLLREAEPLLDNWDSKISRDHYLKWLEQILVLGKRACKENGNHPFSKVHLLTYSEADGQDWSHLILTGLNADCWPPRFEGFGLLSEAQIDQLNLEAKKINFGIHNPPKISALRGMIPGPEENRLANECRFRELVRSVTHSICATASLTDETQPGVSLSPSEYLIHLYYADRGEILTDHRMKELCKITSEWLKDSLSIQAPAGESNRFSKRLLLTKSGDRKGSHSVNMNSLLSNLLISRLF